MKYIIVSILALLLVGCGTRLAQPRPTAAPAEPTATEEAPANTPEPVATIEPTPVAMPLPTEAPEPTVAITQGPRTTDPAGVAPLDKDNCPEEYPIKGNIRDDGGKIYHEPDFRSYGATDPEICFALVQDAVDAGFTRPANT